MHPELQQEVEKMRRVPGFVFAQGSFERVPRIAGTGIEVFEVIGVYKGVNSDWERLRQSFDFLTEEQLKAALRYYREYPEEVRRAPRRRRADLPGTRARARWRPIPQVIRYFLDEDLSPEIAIAAHSLGLDLKPNTSSTVDPSMTLRSFRSRPNANVAWSAIMHAIFVA